MNNQLTLKRIFSAAFMPFMIIIGGVYLFFFKSPLVCPSNYLTGLYCPGCGSGRAAYAMVHLRFAEAFWYNPLLVIASPFIIYFLICGYIEKNFGYKKLPMFNPGKKSIIFLLVIVIIFTVCRNIPVYPYNLLAP